MRFPGTAFGKLALLAGGALVAVAAVVVALGHLRADEGNPAATAPEDDFFTPVLPERDLVIDDFEDAALSREVWHALATEERARALFTIAEGGATAGSTRHLLAELVRPLAPQPADVAGVAARLGGPEGKDVAGAAGVAFWARGTPGSYVLQLGSARVHDHDHFNAYFQIGENGWSHYRLPIEAFRQEGYGVPVEWTGRDVTHVAFFSINPGAVSLAIDEVRFYEE